MTTAVVGLTAAPAPAQRPLADKAEAERIASVVTDFIRAASVDTLSNEDVDRYTTGQFAAKMSFAVGRKPFASRSEYVVRNVQSVNDSDSLASVAITTVGDTLPTFGPVSSELTFFVHRGANGWKIAEMRRFAHIEQRSADVRTI